MKNSQLITGIIGLLFMFNITAYAQDDDTHELSMGIPEVCLLGTQDATIVLELTTTIAGDSINGGTGSGYAQVSSIISSAETRTITGSVTGVPAGTVLGVSTVLPSNGNQGGTLGTGSSNVTLSGTDATLVTGIGSCYTGNGATDGYQFNYLWNAISGSYSSITAVAAASATVTLTITNVP